MVFHILDIALAQEWLGTCQEYLGYVARPFSKMSCKQMWSCKQSNLEDWYTTWSVLHVWWALVINIAACAILIACWDDNHYSKKHCWRHRHDIVGHAVQNLIIGIILAYIWSHWGWFAVVKKGGCCCLLIICMSQAPILLLLFGLWLVVWAVLVILNSMEWLGEFDLAPLYVVLYASYAIPLLYMGLAMLQMWLRKKNEPQLGNTNATVVGNQNV